MTVLDLKREIAALEPAAQNELSSYLIELRLQRDPEHAREMTRRRDDERQESWVRLEDIEAALAADPAPPKWFVPRPSSCTSK